MARIPLIAGNWKMNRTVGDSTTKTMRTKSFDDIVQCFVGSSPVFK